MSYAMSAALQGAVFQHLRADPGVSGLLGTHLYDDPPDGPLPTLFATLGEERVRQAGDVSGTGAWHDLSIAVVTDAAGFVGAKRAAVAICDALEAADLGLARGRLVSLRFVKARARRETDGMRRIDMTFRARVEDA